MKKKMGNKSNQQKHIMMLSLCYPQTCIDKKPYVKITKVESQNKRRISRSLGNVNLTDFWISTLDESLKQEQDYTMQNITLLGDSDPGKWNEMNNKYVCIAFLKLNSNCSKTITDMQNDLKNKRNSFIIYRTFGNADFVVIFSDDQEKCIDSVIKSLVGENDTFFSHYFLCGKMKSVENENYWLINEFKIHNKSGCQKHNIDKQKWSTDTIRELKNRLKDFLENSNKKMSSYYHALNQIVNIISQYEHESLYKDMFFMFYPSINLFLKQLKKAESMEKENNKNMHGGEINDISKEYKLHQKVEISISNFLDTMELLLNHIGSSCRDVFSNTDHGGIVYDIPLRLCMMYIAYLNILTEILNDITEYEYQYCLAPLTYSRPTTNFFDFGLPPESRLIRVKISRSTMYMPRSLLIILAHEVSHYVGNNIRQREERANCFMEIAIKVLCQSLFANVEIKEILDKLEDKEIKEIVNNYFSKLKEYIYIYLRKKIVSLWKEESIKEEYKNEKFFLSVTQIILDKCIQKALIDNRYDFEEKLSYLDLDTLSKIRSHSNKKEIYSCISMIQEKLNDAKLLILVNDELMVALTRIAKVLREAYADLSAILVLNLEPDDFLEAYQISEGYILSDVPITSSLLNRIAVVKIILSYIAAEEKDENSNLIKWKEVWNISNSSEKELKKSEKYIVRLKNEIMDYINTAHLNDIMEEIAPQLSSGKEKENKMDSKISKSDNSNENYKVDFFYNKEILRHELEFFHECGKNLKCYLKEKEKKESIGSLRKLFSHFALNEPGEDNSFEDFFEDYNAMVNKYKEIVSNLYNKKRLSD